MLDQECSWRQRKQDQSCRRKRKKQLFQIWLLYICDLSRVASNPVVAPISASCYCFLLRIGSQSLQFTESENVRNLGWSLASNQNLSSKVE